MKKSIVISLSLVVYAGCAREVATFGAQIISDGAIPSTELIKTLADKHSGTIKVKGEINEVCQAKGCWMTMDLGNDQTMRITFKDYGFFLPSNSSSKTAVVQGVVKRETGSVESLRHYAKDAGKSEEEIASITTPETNIVFVADGVLILD